jgi:hypothetical protein
MTRKFLACTCAFAAFAAACRKEPIPEPPPASVTAPPPRTGSQPQPPNSSAAEGQPSAPIPQRSENEMPGRDEIYNATRRYAMEQRKNVMTVEDLVSKGYLKPLPPPPPGKRYLLNQRGASISIVDR